MRDLIHIPEPPLLFRHNQAMEDPRDGLTLFGPLDESKPYGIKAGVIGTENGVKRFERWVEWVQRPVFSTVPLLGRPPFPGFETVFRSRWNTKPLLTLTVTDAEIDEYLYLDDAHQRVDLRIARYPHLVLLPRIWQLRHNLSAYDAAYIVLCRDTRRRISYSRVEHPESGHTAAIEFF